MEPDLNQKIMMWNKLVEQLADVKQREMELRKDICKEVFTAPTEGVNTYELGKGWALKMDHKINRKIDEPALVAALSQDPTLEEVIQRKPELKLKKYKALDDDRKLILDGAITATPGSPQLKLVIMKRKG